MQRSQTALGAYFRRDGAAQRQGVATFAMARKLAQYIYRLLRWGQPYVDVGAAAYEKLYQQRVYKDLCKRSQHLIKENVWKSTKKFWTN